MKVDDETLTWGSKAIALIASIFVIKKVASIFKGDDGKFSPKEFGKFIGFWWFIWAATYVVLAEGNRPSGSEHVFSEVWLLLIFSGLLTVLHLDYILDKFTKVLEVIARIRAKVPPPADEKQEPV